MPRVIDTDRYLRFERVDAVEETARGLLAPLHGESLRLDVVAPDVVRVKISRGGGFDETPTFAVASDPLAEAVEFAVERGGGGVRLRTAALVASLWLRPVPPAAVVASLWLDPFRLDVHRPDGSPVVETARDDDGRWWANATLNDAFT